MIARQVPPTRPVGLGDGRAAALRLLAARRHPENLRWAIDPDGPEWRELADGEVRLMIVSLRIDAGVWPAVAPGDSGPRSSDQWVPLVAQGEACVVESRTARVPAHLRWCGLLPVSTYVVVPYAPISMSGNLELPAQLSQHASERRAGDCPAPVLQRLGGMDGIERCVRGALGPFPPRGVLISACSVTHDDSSAVDGRPIPVRR